MAKKTFLTDEDEKKYIKSVNGQTPDENGNVEIEIPEAGGVAPSVEPAEDDIPKLYITGTLPTSKVDEDVEVHIRYKSKTADFEYPSTLKVQGHSSVVFPKKNFTWKLYKDDTYEKKQKVSFKNWGEMNKFVLKAHWVDHSHVRNVGAAKIFGAMVRSRSDFDTLPEELRNAPNNGATDGFTVKVFVNGIYHGLYELIVPKDKLFGQDDDNPAHSIVNSEHNHRADCAFATTTPSINGNWSEELQDSMSQGVKTALTNFISFVAGASDEEYVANLANYCDVQSVIDFDIFARLMLTSDSLSQNQIFFSYDDGGKFYEGGWDFDNVLGLFPTLILAPYDTPFQEGYKAYIESGNINLLYKRTEELFFGQFKARYLELRKGVLSESSVIDVFERLTDIITTYDGLLKEDYATTTAEGAFTGIPLKDTNNIQQIREFVAKRFPYMDGVINAMTPPVPCTGISLDKNTLTFTGEGAQTLIATVTPDGCTDAITWESDDTNIATVNGGVVTAVANGSAVITAKCGGYSSTCNVSVSGMAEAVPCTAITLDKSELTFTGEGTQTLTATLTPADTTDVLTWENSDPGIATVEGGVVTAVKNGNTTITARCGNQTASCTVVISGITQSILNGVSWVDNRYIEDGGGSIGTIKTSTIESVTDAFSVDGLDSLYIEYAYSGTVLIGKHARLAFYTAEDATSETFISMVTSMSNLDRTFTAEVPENAVYARFSFVTRDSSGNVIFTGLTMKDSADGNIIGNLPFTRN